MKTIASILVVVTIVVYLAASLVLFAVQRSLLYRADPTSYQPSAVGLPDFTVERLKTEDGKTIVAWYARKAAPSLILYLHGNGGSLAYRAARLQQLASLGTSVLAIDYRGFGGSSGTPTEQGLSADADAAYLFAREQGFAAERIIVLGESLGTGVAVALAARHPTGGIVLAAAYSSIADVAADRYPFFPVKRFILDTFDASALIATVRAPVLILHGTADRVIPIRYAEKLASRAAHGTDFLRIVDGGHLVLESPEADTALRNWLDRLPAFATAR